ncbi:MAG TPA: histone deacetylase [Gemmatimonadaceae bacterium]|nr:histone deacetylase [Gemmatimonadaceae bacterium]
MTLALISHADCGRHDTGWSHPEHVGRIRAVTRALRDHPELFMALEHIEGRHAAEEELLLAHDSAYIAGVRALAAAGGGSLDPDTIVSDGSWDAATAAAGCVLDGVDRALGAADGAGARSFCLVRPPGHHALRARGMGFCLFGSVAIGALHARRRGAERVLIVDWDVHHGNGTQALVEHDRDIRFVSMHQWPWYPGTGPAEDRGPHGNVWNVPMRAGLAPTEYVDALRRAVDEATRGWTPDLVLVSAGFDSLRGDPLGGFTLEMEHVDLLTRWIVQGAEGWCGGRLVSALEGGYNVERLGEACVVHLDALR